MSKNVGFILLVPWPKKLRQPHAAGAQASALSSMHAPVVLLRMAVSFCVVLLRVAVSFCVVLLRAAVSIFFWLG